MTDMFCFQCQQTAGNKCCVNTGVCGKQPDTANLQDELICRLIRLAMRPSRPADQRFNGAVKSFLPKGSICSSTCCFA